MICEETTAEIFYHWLIHAKQTLKRPLGFGLHLYKPKDYEQMLCMLSRDGLTGYAIKPDGELINVFSRPKGQGDALVQEAIFYGATKLDCFETVAHVYRRNGFIETGRDKWDDEYAPEGWCAFRFGTPDVVYMALENKSEPTA